MEALGIPISGPEFSEYEKPSDCWNTVASWNLGLNTPHDEETKRKIRIKIQEYWNDLTASTERRKTLIEWNKTVHSEQMKKAWADPSSPVRNRVKPSGRPKGSRDLKPRKKKSGYKRRTKAEMKKLRGIH